MNYIVKAQVQKKNGRMQAVASTSVEDRHGEVVKVDGWDLKNYKKNPVLLWGHDHFQPAIGNAKTITNKSGDLIFEPVFHDKTPEAAAIKALYEGWTDDDGTEHPPVLNSFSVGFRPLEAEGNTYMKQELLEISAVNVPANPEARMIAAKAMESKGVDEKVIKSVIDIEEESSEDEKKLEELQLKVKELSDKNVALEHEVKVLRGRVSYKAEKRATVLKAMARLTEQAIRDNKKEIKNGKD